MKMSWSPRGVIEHFRAGMGALSRSLGNLVPMTAARFVFVALAQVQAPLAALINHHSRPECVFKWARWLIPAAEVGSQTSWIHRLRELRPFSAWHLQ